MNEERIGSITFIAGEDLRAGDIIVISARDGLARRAVVVYTEPNYIKIRDLPVPWYRRLWCWLDARPPVFLGFWFLLGALAAIVWELLR